MPADTISAGVLLLSWGATYFVHSTCLIAGIWLFVRNRRTASHALRETLWKIALVGGVVTASVQVWLAPIRPFGDLTLKLEGIRLPMAATAADPDAKESLSIKAFDTLNRPEPDADNSLADEIRPVDSGHDLWMVAIDPKTEIARTSDGPNTVNLETIPSPAGHNDRTAPASLISGVVGSLPTVLTVSIALAMLATLLGLARCGWQTILLRRKLAHCRLITAGPARNLLDELLRMVPRAPEVLLLSAPGGSEPAAFGIARWTIVLPPRAAFDLTEDELRALLAHELAHLVRGDSIWLCISRALCSCLAFQPLNHLARREWQRTAEFLCDNWAVSWTGAPLALARCLTEVASWRLTGPASAAILAATGRQSGLVDRIERLLDARPVFDSISERRIRRRTVFAGAVVLAFLAWCAPRVQLVAAGPAVNEQLVPGSLRLAQFDASADESEVVIEEASVTDAAKPQASGERQGREGESQDDALQTASENSAPRAAADNASMIESLDRDLMALASELEQLGPLLQENAVPQAVALAKRLRGEIVRLQQRREVLKALWRKSVN